MYSYETEKPNIFTEVGMETFTKIRDFVQKSLKQTGSVRMLEAMNAGGSGSSWLMMACVDHMVARGELREIQQNRPAGQHRVFVSTRD